MAIAKFDDYEVYYELHGQGSPIVLIAGYTCDHAFWDAVLPILAEHFQVVVFDNRGIGRTKDNGEPFSIETMMADSSALIDRLGLFRPAIVGQSMGGAITQAMFARFPEKFGQCIILNSTQRFRTAAMMALENLLALRKAGVDFDLLIEATVPWLNGSEWLSAQENIAAFKAALKTNPLPQSLADQERQLMALKPFDARPWNKPLDCPTLVISAIEDLLAPAREGKMLAEKLGAAFIEIPGGHASPIEQPERLSRILVEFLS
ncbi:alpha/beta hydrolase [Phyllobacterium salinisoli]|uniref:Alpha/beta hydrolase n=1 Tax=Phyllobacterium salinisoli TaxID=1899321 RepID=A0A368JZU8_9HYPH|nr:alpha/beta hydrolase [Phyllobacterium salinisoli]RCS22676.1 alpha/beta hydrolase [Phyllobacterium salinisoli]